MAMLTVTTLGHSAHTLEVADDYTLPPLASGDWFRVKGSDGSQLSIYANNILTIQVLRKVKTNGSN